jgi:2-desacetyl-2-hydroxyethyl bacteriochlorophyllide A dehydrogenase
VRAVRFHGIGDVRCDEIKALAPHSDEALVRIIYGGICGSDLHIYRQGMFVEKIPETMGHEFIGRVESAPEGSMLKSGALVTGDPRVPCGSCIACQRQQEHRCPNIAFIGEISPGGFAEYLAIRPDKLIGLKPHVDPRQGVLAEPLAVALHACRGIAAGRHEKALIVGAGPIGALIAFLLKKRYNFYQVALTDIDEFRLQQGRLCGADTLIHNMDEAINQYDCLIDTVGSQSALNAALAAIAPGGSLYVSAIYEQIPLCDINLLVGKELQIKGNNAYSFADLEEAAQLLNSEIYDLSWLVSDILPAERAAEAFARLTASQKKDLKILLDFC